MLARTLQHRPQIAPQGFCSEHSRQRQTEGAGGRALTPLQLIMRVVMQ